MVVDPAVLLDELDMLEAKGIDTRLLRLSGNAHLIMPYHQELDRVTERYLGKNKLGTTKRGIGPAYADKALRVGLRVQDLLDPKIFREKLDLALREKNGVLAKVYNRLPFDAKELTEQYLALRAAARADDRRHRAPRARGARRAAVGAVRRRAGDVPRPRPRHVSVRDVEQPGRGRRVHRRGRRAARDRPRRRRREGVHDARRQRARSRPSCSRATRSATCCVEHGAEFGTNTGRRRRTGWLDLVMLKHAVRLNTCTELAITKLDVLSPLPELKVCVAYEDEDGTRYDHVPYHQSVLHKVRPVYETLPGWGTEIETGEPARGAAARGARLRAVHRGLPRRAGDASSVSAPHATRPSCCPAPRRRGARPRRRLRRARARARVGARAVAAVDEVVCAPGNPGMAALGECRAGRRRPIPARSPTLADELDPDLVVVGPEDPLVAGRRRRAATRAGHLAFGPTAAAATLEGSKAWMKDVLAAAGVPTARHAHVRRRPTRTPRSRSSRRCPACTS